MASTQSTADFILEQIAGAGRVHAKKMFGEYGVYCGDKIVGLICDDQFFLKPTAAGRDLIEAVVERAPYPGAKPYFLISGDLCADGDWLAALVKTTAAALPPPKKAAKPGRKSARKKAKK